MKRHLLLVTHYYPAHHGGVEKVAAELAVRLADKHGYEVTWMASDVDTPFQAPHEAVRVVPAKAWNGIERNTGVPWPIWSLGALYMLWRAIGQANIVHLHDALYFGNAFAWLMARLRGVPVVVTQHVGKIPFNSKLLRAAHVLANHTLGRLVLSSSSRVVFISPAVCQEFERFCRFRAPPVYWANGVDTAVFFPDGRIADDPAIVNARHAGRRVFLFVGRFVEKKGLNILRELAGAYPDDLWIFAGRGPLDPAEWGMSNILVVRGASGDRLARYYRAADLLVLPSVGEGFPLVVQESMACGTPVMVGEETAAGCPDACSLMYVEKVGSKDTVQLWTRHLAKILSEPEKMKARRNEVAKFAHENWTWDAAAAQYASLFENLVSRDQKTSANTLDT